MTENPLRAALEDLFELAQTHNLSHYDPRCIAKARAALATPSDAPEQTAKPRHYVNTIAAHNSEMCCRLGITMGHLRDDGSRELECILERLDRAQKQIALQAAPEQATEPFGYAYQHDETGRMTCVSPEEIEENWFAKMNPRWKLVGSLYLAAPSPQQRDESKGETT